MELDWQAALFLGLLQGVAEWLPVSSEGLIASVYSLAYGRSLGEGIEYALWLHAGTVPAALVALRIEVISIGRDFLQQPFKPNPIASYLIIATVMSAVIGLPILWLVTEGSNLTSVSVMALIGGAMLITGLVQLRRRTGGVRSMDAATRLDGFLAGLVQGVSVIPGLSRSGLTVAFLLGRGFQARDALVISLLMSIPASAGAATYTLISSDVNASMESFIALAAAFVTGLLTIRALLLLATRLNYAYFTLNVGIIMVGGALWQVFS